MTATTSTDREGLDSSREVLVFARECQAAANRAQADLMVAAVTWAEQHPPESIDDAATWITPGGDTGLTLAGQALRWWRSSASPSSPWRSVAPPTAVGRWWRQRWS